MQRHDFQHDGLTFSYLDAGGDGQPLVALHSHWFEGITFGPLAAALAPGWRVIAPDQRGHGYSDHAATYTRDDYRGDIDALFAHLHLDRALILGNSLGGVNAYQFAARNPERVRALIIEDIGAEVYDDTSFALAWKGTFPSRETLAARIGPRLAPYLEPSFRETPRGWTLAFDPNDMVSSQQSLNGDHWADWLASDCPALLIRGIDSPLSNADHFAEMVARRPNTRLAPLNGGHAVHIDNPHGFVEAVRSFILDL
jgi:pimeloyl-ACP methyl ester carboxylesterase